MALFSSPRMDICWTIVCEILYKHPCSVMTMDLIEDPLAHGFNIMDGWVWVDVPKVRNASDYQLVCEYPVSQTVVG